MNTAPQVNICRRTQTPDAFIRQPVEEAEVFEVLDTIEKISKIDPGLADSRRRLVTESKFRVLLAAFDELAGGEVS